MPETDTYSIMSDEDSDDDFVMDDLSDEDSDFDFDIETSKSTSKSKSKSNKTSTKKKSATSKSSKKSKAVSIDVIDSDSSDIEMDGSTGTRPVLTERSINSDESDMATTTKKTSTKKSNSKKTVEERYQKLSQLEHILVRPDTYSEFEKLNFSI